MAVNIDRNHFNFGIFCLKNFNILYRYFSARGMWGNVKQVRPVFLECVWTNQFPDPCPPQGNEAFPIKICLFAFLLLFVYWYFLPRGMWGNVRLVRTVLWNVCETINVATTGREFFQATV